MHKVASCSVSQSISASYQILASGDIVQPNFHQLHLNASLRRRYQMSTTLLAIRPYGTMPSDALVSQRGFVNEIF